jgi:hypothetical protein
MKRNTMFYSKKYIKQLSVSSQRSGTTRIWEEMRFFENPGLLSNQYPIPADLTFAGSNALHGVTP